MFDCFWEGPFRRLETRAAWRWGVPVEPISVACPKVVDPDGGVDEEEISKPASSAWLKK